MSTVNLPKLALYHYPSCYFCGIVRQALEHYGIEVEFRDIHQNRDWAQELTSVRGRKTVPVLRIETPEGSVQFMGESRDIIQYLGSLA